MKTLPRFASPTAMQNAGVVTAKFMNLRLSSDGRGY